ncbi:DNA adenine methylase [Bacillus xiapuensis]|uniref:DNA adenine methylase n=1 Tax=Bacillus xiapuensis TaxID=2014075 RepID=A0ABU6N8Z7_9BACI|nr:DNA adenine methylase [Bacillus xiapuensis]
MLNSPISWVGGKHRLRKHIIPLFPEHTCYVEVFGGSGTVLFGKEPSKVEVYNDRFDLLVNLFNVFKEKPDEFLKELDLVPISRTVFNQFKEDYYHPNEFTNVQNAVRFYYLLKAGFGSSLPDMGGCGFGIRTESPSRLNLDKVEKDIRNTYNRIKKVFIENLEFEEIFKRYDKEHTLFYCDPPYIDSREYTLKFGHEEHEKLSEELHNIKGKFLLSINNHELAYELYKDMNILEVDHNYSMRKTIHNTDCKELIISNFETEIIK